MYEDLTLNLTKFSKISTSALFISERCQKMWKKNYKISCMCTFKDLGSLPKFLTCLPTAKLTPCCQIDSVLLNWLPAASYGGKDWPRPILQRLDPSPHCKMQQGVKSPCCKMQWENFTPRCPMYYYYSNFLFRFYHIMVQWYNVAGRFDSPLHHAAGRFLQQPWTWFPVASFSGEIWLPAASCSGKIWLPCIIQWKNLTPRCMMQQGVKLRL